MLSFALFDHHNNSYVICHENHLTRHCVDASYHNSRSATKVLSESWQELNYWPLHPALGLDHDQSLGCCQDHVPTAPMPSTAFRREGKGPIPLPVPRSQLRADKPCWFPGGPWTIAAAGRRNRSTLPGRLCSPRRRSG